MYWLLILCQTLVFYLIFHQHNPIKVGAIIILILLMGKIRHHIYEEVEVGFEIIWSFSDPFLIIVLFLTVN